MVSALDWKIEGNDCGFWLRQADPCTQSIHVATVIVAALAAIAVLGGMLLILAQQGYPMGGINSLAKSIHPTALYASLGAAGTVLTLDCAFIYLLIRGYTNQVLSKEEVDELQLLPNLQATADQLSPLHYSVSISPETPATETAKAKPGVFVVQSKDASGRVSVIPFKTENAYNAHIQRLESSQYEPTQEEDLKNAVKIPLEKIYHLADKAWLEKKCASLSSGLPEGYFVFEPITLAKEGTCITRTLFAARHPKTSEVEFFVVREAEKNAEEVGAEFLSDCFNLATVNLAVNAARTETIKRSLKNKSFVKYETHFIHQIKYPDTDLVNTEEKELYITTYREDLSVNEITEFFLTDQSRTERLEGLGFLKPNSVHLKKINLVVNGARQINMSKPLNNNSFLKYEALYLEKIPNLERDTLVGKEQEQPIYILTYRKNHSVNEITEFFFTEEDRTKRQKDLGF